MAERQGAGASAADDLATRAARTHIVVIGGGIGGLIAARECAKVGMRVTVLEATDAVGGAIRRTELDGIALDAGAESYATRGGHVRALLDELGLAELIVAPAAGGAWLAGIPGTGAAPLPVGGVLGIPSNPFQEDVRRVIGWSGAWRAYLDRVRPPLTIGHQLSLGRLVASRMGPKVRDRLVAPVTTGVYSASPDDVDVDVAAPGLNAALTRVGSLSGAVMAVRQDGAARKSPGAAVEGLVGGMGALVDALLDDLGRFDTSVRTGTRVEQVSRDAGGWRVRTLSAAPAPDAGIDVDPDVDPAPDLASETDPGTPGEVPVAAQLEEELAADAVIVATDEVSARALLSPVVPALAAEGQESAVVAPEIEVVTLLLDAPALDAAPRGTGVLTVPGSHTAKALTHSTAKWEWVRSAANGRHVVRVSFGAQGEPAATAPLDDDAAAALALREASALLGVPLDASALTPLPRMSRRL